MAFRQHHCRLHDGGKVFVEGLSEIKKFPTIIVAKNHRRSQFSMVDEGRTGLNQYQQLPTRWATLFKMLLPDRNVYLNTTSAGTTSDMASFIATKAKANFGEEVVLRMATDYLQQLSDAAMTELQHRVHRDVWKSWQGKIKVMISFPMCFRSLGNGSAYTKLETAARRVKWKHGATFTLVTDHQAALRGTLYMERNQPLLDSIVSLL